VQRRALYLLATLAGAGVLWLLSRTERGQVIAADVVGAAVNAFTPRGIRNNNPGNIEWIENQAARWRGMVGRDGRYGIFDSAANGVRAIGGELRASIRKGQTLEGAIYEWAPPGENDTESYLEHIEAETGFSRAQHLTASMIPAVAEQIIRHENGQQPYSVADIAAWVNA